jgi:hypothetical protein
VGLPLLMQSAPSGLTGGSQVAGPRSQEISEALQSPPPSQLNTSSNTGTHGGVLAMQAALSSLLQAAAVVAVWTSAAEEPESGRLEPEAPHPNDAIAKHRVSAARRGMA